MKTLTDRDKLWIVFTTFDEGLHAHPSIRTKVFPDALLYSNRLFVFQPLSGTLEAVLELTPEELKARETLTLPYRQTLNYMRSFFTKYHRRPTPVELSEVLGVARWTIYSRLRRMAELRVVYLPRARHYEYLIIG